VQRLVKAKRIAHAHHCHGGGTTKITKHLANELVELFFANHLLFLVDRPFLLAAGGTLKPGHGGPTWPRTSARTGRTPVCVPDETAAPCFARAIRIATSISALRQKDCVAKRLMAKLMLERGSGEISDATDTLARRCPPGDAIAE
jgi:hypothetical protein